MRLKNKSLQKLCVEPLLLKKFVVKCKLREKKKKMEKPLRKFIKRLAEKQ